MDYRVELDIYNGPLDLLLYLIKRDELDIHDIPIARITDTYVSYINVLKDVSHQHGLDINLAGDFLVMAATLMEIKSATLLPKPPPVEGADGSTLAELTDPRYELVQKLLEYKRFKDAAMALDRQQSIFQDRFPRVPGKVQGEGQEDDPPVDLEEVQVWDLLEAFGRLMKEVGHRQPRLHEVIYDDTPIDLHAADIEDRLTREPRLSLRQIMVGRASRSEMIGVFLALLELVRQRKVLVIQAEGSDELEIIPAPPEHRAEAPTMHLAIEKASSDEGTEGRRDEGTEARSDEGGAGEDSGFRVQEPATKRRSDEGEAESDDVGETRL